MASQRVRSLKREAGFTFVELVVVMAIMLALLAIAMPAYRSYVTRAIRADAQSVLLEIVSRQEQYAATNRAYMSTATANDLSLLGIVVPPRVAANYNITVAASCLPISPATGDYAGTSTCSVTAGSCACTCACPLAPAACTGNCARAMTGFVAIAAAVAGSEQATDGDLQINQFGLRLPVGLW